MDEYRTCLEYQVGGYRIPLEKVVWFVDDEQWYDFHFEKEKLEKQRWGIQEMGVLFEESVKHKRDGINIWHQYYPQLPFSAEFTSEHPLG